MAKVLVEPTKENIDFIAFNIIYDKQRRIYDEEKKLDWYFTAEDLLKEFENNGIFCYSKEVLETVIKNMYRNGQLSIKYDNSRGCVVYHFCRL